MDDSFLWTASGSPSFRRWKVPQRRAVRIGDLTSSTRDGVLADSPLAANEGDDYVSRRNSFDHSRGAPGALPLTGSTSARTRAGSPSHNNHRLSLSPSLSPSLVSAAPPEPDPYGEHEGEETWYGIPFESLVRLTSPHDSFAPFNNHGSLARGRDPEIATLYSAASVVSMPRHPRPISTALANAMQQRSASPFLSSRTRLVEDAQTLHPGTRARTAFEEREVAADAVPYNHEPDEAVQGEHGLVRCVMLNDRVHVLTVDTAGEVAVWDVIRGVCRGCFVSEDVAVASCGSSAASMSGDGDSAREWSPREAIETVRERIEGEAVVQSWATVDTKTGVLTVHLTDRCFEAEIYADEAGYTTDRRYGGEEQRRAYALPHSPSPLRLTHPYSEHRQVGAAKPLRRLYPRGTTHVLPPQSRTRGRQPSAPGHRPDAHRRQRQPSRAAAPLNIGRIQTLPTQYPQSERHKHRLLTEHGARDVPSHLRHATHAVANAAHPD